MSSIEGTNGIDEMATEKGAKVACCMLPHAAFFNSGLQKFRLGGGFLENETEYVILFR